MPRCFVSPRCRWPLFAAAFAIFATLHAFRFAPPFDAPPPLFRHDFHAMPFLLLPPPALRSCFFTLFCFILPPPRRHLPRFCRRFCRRCRRLLRRLSDACAITADGVTCFAAKMPARCCACRWRRTMIFCLSLPRAADAVLPRDATALPPCCRVLSARDAFAKALPRGAPLLMPAQRRCLVCHARHAACRHSMR